MDERDHTPPAGGDYPQEPAPRGPDAGSAAAPAPPAPPTETRLTVPIPETPETPSAKPHLPAASPFDSPTVSITPPSPRWTGASRRRVTGLLWSFAVTIILLFPALRLLTYVPLPFERARAAIAQPWYQMDNEEGALLFQALEMRQGRGVYRPLTDYPFVAGTYPPLYPAIAAAFTPPGEPGFRAGRIVSLGACVGIAMMLLAAVAVRGRNLVAGAVAALVFLCTFEVNSWLPYFRVDMLAVLFSVMGLCTYAISPRDRDARVMAVAFFALAFFTKQTQVAAPLAVAAHLALTDRRAARRWVSWMAAAVAVPFALMTLLTRGQFFVHTVIYNMNTYHARDLAVWARHAWRLYPWLIAAALVAAAFLVAMSIGRRRHPDAESVAGGEGMDAPPPSAAALESDGADAGDGGTGSGVGLAAAAPGPPRKKPALPAEDTSWIASPVALYALLSLLDFLAIGKAGSAENYLIEPLAAFALLACDTVARLARHQAAAANPWPARAGAFAVAACLSLHASHADRVRGILFSRRPPSHAELDAALRVTRAVRAQKGDTFSELGAFNILARQPLWCQPFIMSELARQGRWDQGPFVRDLRRGRFALLVTTFDIATDATDTCTTEMLQAMRARYREEERISPGGPWEYHLYRPAAPVPLDMNLVSVRRDGSAAL